MDKKKFQNNLHEYDRLACGEATRPLCMQVGLGCGVGLGDFGWFPRLSNYSMYIDYPVCLANYYSACHRISMVPFKLYYTSLCVQT